MLIGINKLILHRFDRNKFLYIFLLIAPFINIINHRMSPVAIYIILIIFIILSLLNFKINKKYSLQISYLTFVLLVCLNLYIVYVYNIVFLNNDISYHIRFFGLFIIVLIYMMAFFDLKRFIDIYYIRLLKYYIIIISLSILIDYVILHSDLDISLQLMYSSEAYSYMDRPFGIFGQPSVNSVLLVFFYILLMGKYEPLCTCRNKIYFFIVTAGIILQGSGSGFIVYIMMLMVILLEYKNFKYIIIILTPLVLYYIISNNIIEKISLAYLVFLIEHSLKLINLWICDISSIMQVLFGGITGGIDFGPVYFISHVGLVYFTILTSMFLYLIYKSKNKYNRTAFLVLLIGNLHYPVIFYILMNFVLPLVIYDTLHRKNNVVDYNNR